MTRRADSSRVRNLEVALPFIAMVALLAASAPQRGAAEPLDAASSPQEAFWTALRGLCGRAFEGRMVEGTAASDAAMKGVRMVMHVRTCEAAEVRIPFHVGDDRSRTWVVTRTPGGLRLKHDHRHQDGAPDPVTHYGGDTAERGTAERQEFRADAETAALLPASATNVWSLELRPGERFAYALGREGRRFRAEFDLSREVAAPPPPWGHAAGVRTLVHAGTLIDGTGGPPRRRVTIVVDGDRIAGVEEGFRAPAAGERLVDMKEGWVLPGLIDLHVHLGTESAPGSYLERFTQNPADVALRAAAHARATLRAGFTTVRNLGDGHNTTISLRDAVRNGWVEGPRIYSAGKSLATTGGHADPTNAWSDQIEGDPGPREGVVNGPADAAKAVRQRYKDGADLIKITATGGVLSLARSPDAPQFSDEELEAVVRTARDYGLTVAAHAHGAEGMKRAVRAGVTSIEHGTFMDEEAIRLMKQHGTWWVPTLSAGIFVAEKSRIEGFYPDIVRPKAARVGVEIRDTFARAYRA
jgi:imidazolonepropionase-like amidohydrolase